MIRLSALIVLLIVTGSSIKLYAQMNKGYVVTNDGEQVEVYFDEEGFSDNPDRVSYRTSPEGEAITGSMEDIAAFWLPGKFKYIRQEVLMDRPEDPRSGISKTREPQFNSETLFLKVVLEGEATLYSYKEGRLLRFFYRVNDGAINQLVYKKYMGTVIIRGAEEDQLKVNESFKQQIQSELVCEDITANTIKNTSYRRSSLTNVFKAYNTCKGAESVSWHDRKTLTKNLKFSVRLGLSRGRLLMPRNVANLSTPGFPRRLFSSGPTESDLQTVPTLALEFEYLQPLKKAGTLSFFLETEIQSVSGELPRSILVEDSPTTFTYDFTFFTVMIGGRYYLPEYKKFSPFVDLGLGFVFASDEIELIGNSQTASPYVVSSNPIRTGIGITFDQRFDLTLKRVEDRGSENETYDYTGISLGYKF
ncbi:MAG: hypothetical protein AAFW89_15040 [Bacteroidota bacterium]